MLNRSTRWKAARHPGVLLAPLLLQCLIGARPAAPFGCNHDGFRNGLEQCDGNDRGDYRCTDFCFENGTLACKSDCTFDFSGCCRCGDDLIQAACNEACDGTALNNHTCLTEGFPEGGPLGCKATCDAFDTNFCWYCGDGKKQGPEDCDTNDFGGAGLNACTGPWPEHGGFLSCKPGQLPSPQYPAACTVERWSCWTCGDGKVDPGEACDDSNLTSGDGCSATCQRECGDGAVQRTEGCDDGNTASGDGCSHPGCNSEIVYFGGGDEVSDNWHYDQCVLRWGVEAPFSGSQPAVTQQANGITVACRDNATSGGNACDRDTALHQCTFLAFYCLRNDPLDGISCSPRLISRIALLGATTLDTAARTAVLDSFASAMIQIGGAATVAPVTPLAGELAAIAPNVPVNTVGGLAPMCGAIQVVVGRPGTSAASKVLAIKATDTYGTGRHDIDQLTFVCDP